jgi:hypothetical protein
MNNYSNEYKTNIKQSMNINSIKNQRRSAKTWNSKSISPAHSDSKSSSCFNLKMALEGD